MTHPKDEAREALEWSKSFIEGVLNTKNLGPSDSRFGGETLVKIDKAFASKPAAPIADAHNPEANFLRNYITEALRHIDDKIMIERILKTALRGPQYSLSKIGESHVE